MDWVDWIALGVIIAFSAVVYSGWWLARRRIESNRTTAMQQASPEFGLDYVVDGSRFLASEGFLESVKLLCPYPSPPLVGRNYKNVFIRGDSLATLFDAEFQFVVAEGPPQTDRFTVAAFRFLTDAPDFTMHPRALQLPRRIAGGINVALGAGSSDGDRAFANNYVVRGEDEAAIIRLFDSRVLAYFAQERGWSVESRGGWLLVWRARPKKRVAPKNLSQFMQNTTRIAELFGVEAAGEGVSR